MDQIIKPFALVASDLHLKRRTWSNRPIEGDSYFAWEQIVEQAITHEVKVVILAGGKGIRLALPNSKTSPVWVKLVFRLCLYRDNTSIRRFLGPLSLPMLRISIVIIISKWTML